MVLNVESLESTNRNRFLCPFLASAGSSTEAMRNRAMELSERKTGKRAEKFIVIASDSIDRLWQVESKERQKHSANSFS